MSLECQFNPVMQSFLQFKKKLLKKSLNDHSLHLQNPLIFSTTQPSPTQNQLYYVTQYIYMCVCV